MRKFSNHAVSFALLLLYTCSQLHLLIEAIGCHVLPRFYLWAALLCLTTWVTTGTRRGWLVGMPSSVLLLCFAFYRFPANLSEQLSDAFDRLTGAYLEQVVYPGEVYRYLNLAEDHSLLLLFLAFLLASYMGAALSSHSGRVGLSLLGSIPLFAASLAVTIQPSVPAVFGMLLFWFLLAVGGAHFDAQAESYRAVLALLLPLGLLLGFLIWRVDPARYRYEPQRFDLTAQFDKLLQELDERWNDSVTEGRMTRLEARPESADDTASVIPETVWQNEAGQLDLTAPFDAEALSRVYLRVRSGESGLMYLRCVSYGDYLGTSWALAQEGVAASSLPYAAAALAASGAEAKSVQIEALSDSSYRCLPYFSAENGGYDSYVPSGRETHYTASYYPFPSGFSGLTVSEPLREQELSYRSYVRAVYTRLPAGTLDSLEGLCRQAGLTDSDDMIRDVAAYVQQTGRYSLDTAPYPSGDYAVYFLTAAREGWCLHFATAAVALYRTLGIPARLVEGFLVETEAGRYAEVKGYNAHAWVEVYQDGLGWLPVEVTGQSDQEAAALGASEATPEPSAAPSAVPESDTGEASPVPFQPAESEAPSLPVGLLTQEALEEAETARRQGMSRFAIPLWLVIVLPLLSVLPLRRLLLLALRRRAFNQTDANRAVVALYRSAARATVFGLSVPEELVTCAEKAVFSRCGVSQPERNRCRAVYERFLDRGERELRALDRFRFRWFYVFK